MGNWLIKRKIIALEELVIVIKRFITYSAFNLRIGGEGGWKRASLHEPYRRGFMPEELKLFWSRPYRNNLAVLPGKGR